MPEYDVVVIGAGPAGENAAGRCADHGLSTAIVERELVGGECSFWGCIPSKGLIRPGDVLAATRRVPGAAEAISGPIDVGRALARRDELTEHWDDAGQVPWLDDKHVTLFRGHGRLNGERTVDVQTDGGIETLQARRAVVIATGSRAALPPVDGLADAKPWTNREATEAKAVPRRLLVIGGGAVGCELAQAFRRLGSDEVTVVDAAPRLLAREEPFASDEVKAAFEGEGTRVVLGATIDSVHREAGVVTAKLGDGTVIEADEVLVAAGRRLATDDIGLETVGLTPGKAISVDDRLLATGVAGGWLYALGDCNGLALLTHMGKYQARICADVIAGKSIRDVSSRDAVSRVTFTDPQVCAVGLTEQQARERGFAVRTVRFGTGDVSGASVEGVGLGGTSQLVIDEARAVIIGATFTGPATQELLHAASIAVVAATPLDVLWHAVPSFPTVSEVWLRLLEAYGL
ncbi:MAG: NAD(P)/FAD-dependent oxidoreductase [Candidatus Dormibacteraeota bacterium]|nr:NAD(P)/FAD-dependent oxidoreductase [Candidatus Dormibacteraeota bacterium]